MRSDRLILVWLALWGCSGEPGPAVMTADSAGIQVTISAESSHRFAAVEEPALIDMGGADASGAEQFFQIERVQFDAQGRIWVADGRSGELRTFLPDGSHWKTSGGLGEGPGEFQRIRLLGFFRGDSIALGDRGNTRVTVLDARGELARVETLASNDHPGALPHRVFNDGSILAQVPRIFEAGSVSAGQILGDTARLVRLEVGGSFAPLAEVAGPKWLWTGRSQVPIPFTANPGLGLARGALHVTYGRAFRISVFRAGGLAEVYGVDRPEQAVTDLHIAEQRAMIDEFVSEPQRRDYLLAVEHEERPTALPAYVRLVVDGETNVWAQWFSPDNRWDVFGPSRHYLGRVDVPERFQIWDVKRDQVVGVFRDDLGVEYVRVYRLSR